jgi:hypothetical protein
MRQGCPERKHPYQQTQTLSCAQRIPADDELHAQRVNTRQCKPHGEPKGHCAGQSLAEQREAGIAGGTEQGTHHEDSARRKAVGQAAKRES